MTENTKKAVYLVRCFIGHAVGPCQYLARRCRTLEEAESLAARLACDDPFKRSADVVTLDAHDLRNENCYFFRADYWHFGQWVDYGARLD